MDEQPSARLPIERAIVAAGGKQSDLAARMGCAQQTVSKLLSGEIAMTADWALRISAATDFAVPPADLYPPLTVVAQHERAAGLS
jgi:DNA-binding transcriptional regulator YdaS (Cro superfamily)